MAEINEIANRAHDQIAGTNFVTEVLSTKQERLEITADAIYEGNAYAGASESDSRAWLLEKTELADPLFVTKHATDSWTNRASATYS